MSTPSTVTSTIPAAHSQYGYARIDNPYSTSISAYPTNNSLPAPRLANSYNTFPTLHPAPEYTRPNRSPLTSKQPSVAHSMATSTTASSRPPAKRKPDWKEYFKNGPPTEFIVIDDDSPQPQGQLRGGGRHYEENSRTSNADKKRKIDQSYEGEYHDSPTFSHYPAKFGNSS